MNKLLVSTVDNGLLLVDLDTKVCTRKLGGHFTGLANWRDGFIIASGSSSTLCLVDKNFKFTRLFKLGENLDLHGITTINNEDIYVAETAMDRINHFRIINDKLYHIKYLEPFLKEHDSFDRHHLNDFLIINDQVYLSGFNYDITSTILGDKVSEGMIMKFDINNPKDYTILYLANKPHSPINHPDGIYYCESGLLSLSKEGVIVKQTNNWTRGLAYDNKNIYIGCSTINQHRMPFIKSDMAEHFGITDLPDPRCGILVWNPVTNEEDFIQVYANEIYNMIWVDS